MTLIPGDLVVTRGPGTRKVGVVIHVSAESMFRGTSKLCKVLLTGEPKAIAFMSDSLKKVNN